MDGMRRSITFNTGSSLVEVLVTVVLLTVGLLGASKMHVASLRAQHDSALASSATQLAASMAERLRGNVAAMAAPDADNPYLGFDYSADTTEPADAGAPACFAGANCNPAQLAQSDLGEWRAQLHAALPGARLRICRDLPAGESADGVPWECSGAAHAPVVIKLGWRGRQTDRRLAANTADGMDVPKLVWQVASGGAP